jgi:hypothetical protein
MNRSPERGAALLITLLVLTMIAAVAAALALTATSEAILVGDFAGQLAARYAAEAGLERALVDLSTIADWNAVLDGSALSTFVDGAPAGMRRADGGVAIDLAQVTNLANCGKAAFCSAADLTSNGTGQRPWGTNNPVWRPFAYGAVTALLPPGAIRSPFYVVVLAADDPAETDGNPLADGTTPCGEDAVPPDCNPGSGAIALRAESFGPRGAHHAILAIVERAAGGIRLRSQQMSGVT